MALTEQRDDPDDRPAAAIPTKVKVQRFFAKHLTKPGPHRWMYSATGGLIGGRLPGVQPRVLLLTTTGRVTGKRRTTPVVYFEIGDRVVVVGTNSGADHDPQWTRNLDADPRATIQTGRSFRQVRSRRTTGDERAWLWEEIVAIHPLFATYEEDTDRDLPVMVLVRVGARRPSRPGQDGAVHRPTA
ncbi:MAG: nitroreductase/quinone reductase family protein [Acidimicrobiales bacterium]|nr:nitroreductase/quinone reductase family protein [Acidimicrobiales bacterium]